MKDKLIIAAGLILLIAVVATCNKCWVPPDPVTVKTDTVYVHVKDSTPWYQPQISVLEPGRIPDAHSYQPPVVRVDSFIRFEVVNVKVDTAAILRNYFAKAYYSDTTKTKYGTVVIQDTVTQNRIAARRVLTDFQIPEVTKTVTVTKQRRVLYVGVNVMANPVDFINRAGLSLMYKAKNEFAIEAGAMYGKDRVLNYQAGLKLPLFH
jgi:hypothetical protein